MAKRIKVGLIGYGMSGEVFHAPLIVSNPCFELTKVVERKQKKSKKRYPWVEVVGSAEELIQDQDVELVIVAASNLYHYDLARSALLNRKHVVIEKPITPALDQAQELINLAKKQNKVLSVFHNRRWDGDFLTVQEISRRGLLGNLVGYQADFSRFRSKVDFSDWRESGDPGSGVLFDLGSHLIDQALCLFGLPETVSADIRIQREGGKADDCFELILGYPGLAATLTAGMLTREKGPHFVLRGSHGSFVKYGMDPQEEMLKNGLFPGSADWGADPEENWGALNTQINGLSFKGKIKTMQGCYQKFYENVYDAIASGAELFVRPEQAMNSVRIIELAVESNSKKRTVHLAENETGL